MLTSEEKIIFAKVIPHLPPNPVIFDVGAHKGEYTDYVKSIIPNADCYLFEPNKELYEGLKMKGYKVSEHILCDRVGNKTFYTCKGKADEMSSTYKRSVFDQVQCEVQLSVQCRTVSWFCANRKIDTIHFIKIDVEGAELDVLKGAKRMLSKKRILFAQVEYGGTYPDAGITFKQVIEYLEKFDYKVYELKGDELSLLTTENFIEDFRFANFLITYLCI